jgi:hypothetical protein
MREVELETKSAGKYAWFALQDARRRSLVNESHFDQQVKLKAERMKLVLDLLYYSSQISITYNKGSVRVKVHAARPRDRKRITEWETIWADDGIEIKKVTGQGVIYLVPKDLV